MTEELQALIDRIKKEGVEKAESQAQDILSRATETAAQEIEHAERDAAGIVERAKKEAARVEESGAKALQQVARNVIISVGKALEKILHEAVAADLERVFETKQLADLVDKLLDQLAAGGTEMRTLELVVSHDDCEAILAHNAGVLADKLKAGVQLRADPTIRKGFRISYTDKHLHHDFTDEAIAESLSALLHPTLATLVADALADAEISSTEKEE